MNERLQRILANPTLHRNALTDEERRPGAINWHGSADSPRSSQALCISAFGVLRDTVPRDKVLDRLVATTLPAYRAGGRAPRWRIFLEYEEPRLLNEFGAQAQPTSVDALLVSSKAVVAIEAKFISDASAGFGKCSAFTKGRCAGFYGPGSYGSSQAWCQLEAWHGDRSPRTYWALGREYFRPDVFRMQQQGESCPLRSTNYQLMRNYLFAAARSRAEGIPTHGVITIAPTATSQRLRDQVAAFESQVLLPSCAGSIRHTTYEEYARHLRGSGDGSCAELADFLEARIHTVIGQ
ncbi:MAG: hypothetical protein OXH52_20550 [Gammaproteobacteria bacterium]|nr:hypothetical protein [Gammaproteobacteria bacterium]